MVMKKQIALCIGNNDYNECLGKLKSAVSDATLLAEKLTSLNFDVDLQLNLSSEAMHKKIDAFEKKLPEYDVALFYFAGHGFEYEGDNLLMPIDISDGENSYLKWQALTIETVIDALEGKHVKNEIKTKIIILDACRQSLNSRGGVNSFAPIFAPVGTIIAFSTSPGQTAYESANNGYYTKALLTCIDMPRIPIENMFKHVREIVAAESKGKQISWEHTSLMGTYYFNEDRIQSFSVYSPDVYADSNYIFNKGNYIGKLVIDLKSHDWHIQNPAISDINNIDWNNVSVNDLFVLGRNIYQAAEGGAFKAQQFIRDFMFYNYILKEARIHILNGMAFEIYYDREGKLRNKFKSNNYAEILSLLENEKLLDSRNFIANKLCEENNVVIYIPGSEERMEFHINLKDFSDSSNEKHLYIDSIYYHGEVFYNKYEGDDYNDRPYTLDEIKRIIAKKILAPLDMVIIKSNIEISTSNPILFSLGFYSF